MPRSVRVRFIAKARVNGRTTVWGVYDRERAAWPALVPGFGHVAQDMPTEAAAQSEADRLTRHHEKD